MGTRYWFQFRWVAIGLMAFCMSVTFQVQAHGDAFEGFDAGVIPPAHWTHISDNTSYTWEINSTIVQAGLYSARCPWNFSQDEWLVSPYLTNPSSVTFYSQGSLFWCRDTNDNCDLEVWLIKGTGVNDGDDVMLGKADDDWSSGYQFSSFNPSSDPGTRSRIAFRYVGSNGFDVYFDSISIYEHEEIRIDFGDNGLYHYDSGGAWHRLSPSNAQWMGTYGDKLVADFGALGLYTYDGYTWLKISTGDADNSGNTMVAYKKGLVVDFGANGVWYYDAGGSWSRLSMTNAQWLGVYDDKLVADVGTFGMYEYDGATWAKITTGDADNSGNTMVAFNNGLVVDFGASGLYYYNGTSWTSLGPTNAQWLVTGGGGLYTDFGALGFYRFNGSSWSKISTSDADNSGNTMVGVGAVVVVDFGTSGIYLYSYFSDAWRRLSPSNAQWLRYNNYDYVYADFGTFGVYQTNGLTWTKISTSDADNNGNTMVSW